MHILQRLLLVMSPYTSMYVCFQVTGEVGIIESISLRNFMCHSMLGPFAFGPNVNFVVGNNGSMSFSIFNFLVAWK